MNTPLQSTVVVGAGAVGSFFGAMLARAGRRVTLVGRAAHVEAIERDGLQLQWASGVEPVRIAATTTLDAVREADLVLVCVKSADSDAIARQIAPLLRGDAIVASLQNGVDNADAIARHVRQPVLPAVVYVATEMPAPGVVAHHGRGDLVIGARDAAAAKDAALAARMQAVVDLFAAAKVPVRISADVVGELWSKLLVNCAYNAISALSQLPYGRLVALPEVRTLQQAVVREVLDVARAEGHPLDRAAAAAAVDGIAAAMAGQLSSTAQDLARGKPTEIDHLNGSIVRRGAAHGIATPVNQALVALVKLAESARAAA
ncbi:MAG: 2-dehydropantoate 2-reductase [Burkholderiaceae bacterium]|nr:2-dehydropantoate 2-reductase [Burkholderiaceae bacterium]